MMHDFTTKELVESFKRGYLSIVEGSRFPNGHDCGEEGCPIVQAYELGISLGHETGNNRLAAILMRSILRTDLILREMEKRLKVGGGWVGRWKK